MNVTLNGQPFAPLATVTNLAALMDTINAVVPDGHVVNELFVDGQDALTQDFNDINGVNLASVHDITVTTCPLSGELARGLDDLVKFVDDVVPSIEDAAFQIRLGNVGPASESLAACFEGVGLALRNLEQIYSVLPAVGLKINPDEKAIFTSLADASLPELMTAYNQKSWPELGTRLRDDLLPVLTGWRDVLQGTSARLMAVA